MRAERVVVEARRSGAIRSASRTAARRPTPGRAAASTRAAATSTASSRPATRPLRPGGGARRSRRRIDAAADRRPSPARRSVRAAQARRPAASTGGHRRRGQLEGQARVWLGRRRRSRSRRRAWAERPRRALDARAGQDQLEVVRVEREGLVDALLARLEPAGARQRERERAEDLAARRLSRTSGSAAAYQFAAVAGEVRAAASAARREQRHGLVVARAGEAGDVVGALRRVRPARLQRRRHALVGGEPPGGRRRVVDRPPDQRVPEREPARLVGAAHEVGRRERVEDRRVGSTPAAVAASSGSNGSPATAAPRTSVRAASSSRRDLAARSHACNVAGSGGAATPGSAAVVARREGAVTPRAGAVAREASSRRYSGMPAASWSRTLDVGDVAEQRAGRRVVQRRGRELLEARVLAGGVEQDGWRPRTGAGRTRAGAGSRAGG